MWKINKLVQKQKLGQIISSVWGFSWLCSFCLVIFKRYIKSACPILSVHWKRVIKLQLFESSLMLDLGDMVVSTVASQQEGSVFKSSGWLGEDGMFWLCLHGLSPSLPQSKYMHVRLTCNYKVLLVVNGCLSLCSDWKPVQGIPCILPYDSWDWLLLPWNG